MNRQRGAALLVILLIVGALGAYFAISALNSGQAERDQKTANTLAQAKEALIGNAVSVRRNNLFGFLLAPDLGSTRNTTPNEGDAAGSFAGNTKNLSIIGRLPWRTLGLPPLKDATGECLWYAVSGSAQNLAPADVFNWDSIGHFDAFSSNGTPAGTVSTSGTNYHNRPIALVFSPGTALPGQTRGAIGPDIVAECGGNYNVRNYLDTFTANANINNILNYFNGSPNGATGYAYALNAGANASQLSPAQLAAPKAIIGGKVDIATGNTIANDKVLPITATEIFERAKRRSDFKSDIDDMIGGLALCLNNLPLASLPATSVGNKGIDGVVAACPATAGQAATVLANWRDNLLYALAPSTVNGAPGCNGVLIFSGERTNRTIPPLTPQSRVSAAERGSATVFGDPAMYLEGTNATLFPLGGNYTGLSGFSGANASTDVVRCIKGLPPGATQKSFSNDFGSFVAVGTGVTPNPSSKTVAVATGPSTSGGCFWYPQAIPLAGKVLRAFYNFQFMQADSYALTGLGTDLGKGFTFQMVNNELGIPPNVCGLRSEMGILNASNSWGYFSFIFETDVYRDTGSSGDADPVENHTAIMVNGNLNHSVSGTISPACNGSAVGCQHAPANKFEESPPQLHNQRIEIYTGCNATCSICNPAGHVSPNTYARITAWVDCADCSDVVTDLDRVAKPPKTQRCIALDPKLNTFYFGFTGGFLGSQGVTLRNLILRSE